MPSLRRTFSSPSVRSSPYPTGLSSNTGSGRRNGQGRRCSSGTETSSRRVLADIEWWRVVDGQRDLEPERGLVPREQGHVTEETGGAEHPLMPLPPVGVTFHVPQAPQPSEAFNLPTSLFVSLSIAPTPRGHSPQSSSSSVVATPTATEVPLDDLRLSIAGLDLNTEFLPALPTVTHGTKSIGAGALAQLQWHH